ncbi:hypothetical protein [Streptomyces sp. NPDC048282]|uniref:MmyB family transcriptional regulator n=1 Tax=Streptomyces sp. NPDC048282 TaxID=3365528 RepID=UPI003713FBCB
MQRARDWRSRHPGDLGACLTAALIVLGRVDGRRVTQWAQDLARRAGGEAVAAQAVEVGALLGDFTRLPVTERNLLSLLLHPEAEQTCPERYATVAELTAMLRAQVAADPGNPRAVELVGELAVRSDEFVTLWARHDVGETTRGRMRVNHPLAGELNLDWDAYPLPGTPGPMVIVYTAVEGSPDAERLQLLASLLNAR